MNGKGSELIAISKTILRLMAKNCPQESFGLMGGDFALVQLADLARERPSRGYSMALYGLTMNTSMRSQAPRRGGGDASSQPLALDLHYLLTPWAAQAEAQLRMLGWAVSFLDRLPRIEAEVVNAVEPGALRAGSVAHLLLESLPLADYLELLHPAGQAMPTSITFMARVTVS